MRAAIALAIAAALHANKMLEKLMYRKILAVMLAVSSATGLFCPQASAQALQEMTFYSIGSEDGYVTESARRSDTGGAFNSSASGNDGLRVGDDSSDRWLKSIISFDTSVIPDDARISSAALDLVASYSNRTTGQFEPLHVHIKKGFFGSSTGLESADFSSASSMSRAGVVTEGAIAGAFHSDLEPSALAYVNKAGRTQLRLAFTTPTDSNRLNNYRVFYSGEQSSPSIRPVLRVQFASGSVLPPSTTPVSGSTATATPAAPTATVAGPAKTPTATPTPERTATGISPVSCSGTTVSATSALPVFPGAEGHGTRTVAGSGRNYSRACTVVYRVTNLNDSGTGSLRACVEARGPRVCIFEVGGVLKLAKALTIKNPYITIAGQTAPFPGIILSRGSLIVSASNVLVQHLISRVGDDPSGQDPGSRDGVNTYATSGSLSNIVFDHVSIAWALDEGWSIAPYMGDISNITLSNSIIASGLDLSIHPDAGNPGDLGHSKGTLINSSKTVKNLSYHHNLLAHNADRNIRIAVPISMEYINNLIYGWGRGGGSGRLIELSSSSALHMMDLIGNNYVPGPDSFCPQTQYETNRCSGTDDPTKMSYMITIPSSSINQNSRYYFRGNLTNTRRYDSEDDWKIAGSGFFKNIGSLQLYYPSNRASAPVASSHTVTVLPASTAMEYVLTNAGARPKERDAVDVVTVNDVRNRTGHIINCVSPDGSSRCSKNGGGWPLYPVKQRALSLPYDPNGDANGNGYTNLEEWLFAFSDVLE